MSINLKRIFLFFILFAASLNGCDKKDGEKGKTLREAVRDTKGKIKVAATTTMLKDMVQQLGGDDFEVGGIMSPGGDPHIYKPKPSDAEMVSSARIVLTSGFHLEGWMERLMENAGGVEKVYIVATDGQKPRKVEGNPNALDPHFWFDLKRWKEATEHVSKELQGVPGLPEEVRERITERTNTYVVKIDKTDAWARQQLATIPEKLRVLVTSHDAFGYFGESYHLEVRGIQGFSTEQEASQRDVANVIDMVNNLQVPAVFFETSTNPNLIKQVKRETKAKLAGPLYSDSIGVPNGPADTFLKTFRENVRMIVQALGGNYQAFQE